MTFKEILHRLDHFTAPPKDGDYDEHVQNAMRAVYDLMRPQGDLQLLRLSHLVKKLSMSKSAIRKLMLSGDFPKPIRLGKNIDVWNEETINRWFKVKEGSVLPESDLPHGEK